MKIEKRFKGFTLIELLAVMAIVGILITIMLPNVLGAIRRGQETQCLSNLRTINTAVVMCFSKTRDWTACNNLTTAGDAASPSVLFELGGVAPICPITGAGYALTAGPVGIGGMVADITGHFNTNGIDGAHNP